MFFRRRVSASFHSSVGVLAGHEQEDTSEHISNEIVMPLSVLMFKGSNELIGKTGHWVRGTGQATSISSVDL